MRFLVRILPDEVFRRTLGPVEGGNRIDQHERQLGLLHEQGRQGEQGKFKLLQRVARDQMESAQGGALNGFQLVRIGQCAGEGRFCLVEDVLFQDAQQDGFAVAVLTVANASGGRMEEEYLLETQIKSMTACV